MQTIKQECLDQFIAFGHEHLNDLVREFVEFYNATRPHSNKSQRPPCEQSDVPEWESIKLDEVCCDEKLGGVIKSMRRRAALEPSLIAYQNSPISAIGTRSPPKRAPATCRKPTDASVLLIQHRNFTRQFVVPQPFSLVCTPRAIVDID